MSEKTVEEIKMIIRSHGGEVTHSQERVYLRRRGHSVKRCEVEGYFSTYEEEKEREIRNILRFTPWMVDFEWDRENGGVKFTRRTETY